MIARRRLYQSGPVYAVVFGIQLHPRITFFGNTNIIPRVHRTPSYSGFFFTSSALSRMLRWGIRPLIVTSTTFPLVFL